MIQCQRRDCPNEATHAVKFGLPHISDPDDAPPRATAMIGVVLCEDHIDAVDAQDFVETNPAIRQSLVVAMGSDLVPDFARLCCIGVPLGSPEYSAYRASTLAPKAN